MLIFLSILTILGAGLLIFADMIFKRENYIANSRLVGSAIFYLGSIRLLEYFFPTISWWASLLICFIPTWILNYLVYQMSNKTSK